MCNKILESLRSYTDMPELLSFGTWRCVTWWIVADVSEQPGASTSPKDGGSTFLRNVGNDLPDYTALHLGRYNLHIQDHENLSLSIYIYIYMYMCVYTYISTYSRRRSQLGPYPYTTISSRNNS
jgi:hypothetical protein